MSQQNPDTLHYTKEHEWIRDEGDDVVVGITAFAAEQLGDVVFVELPEVGTEITANDTFGTVESVKSVSDLYAPLTGTVAAINDELVDAPELVNESPFEQGWMIRITPSVAAERETLLSAADYEEVTKG
ncbi:MAG: glycine cleavage system protein GcvH [Magnetococcales bacterium]|nr:glycine cleavage system protein GcvH [Magnetococcales bacterium]